MEYLGVSGVRIKPYGPCRSSRPALPELGRGWVGEGGGGGSFFSLVGVG